MDSSSRSTGILRSSRSWRALTAGRHGHIACHSPASPLDVPVGAGWLGRVCNGRGEPIDGGPPVPGHATAPVAGYPLEPDASRAARRAGAHRRLRDRCAHHPRPRPEAADLLGGRAAAPGAGRPDRRPVNAGDEPFSVVFAANGPHPRRRRRGRATASRSVPPPVSWLLLLNTADDPVIERILTPRIALDRRRAPRLRAATGTCWSCWPT